MAGAPTDTDAWNRAFASEQGALVVALNYGKAPGHAYPGPTGDVEALALAALADGSLPVDARRVAVAGWSAGGNLAVAAARREALRGRVGAVVALYPVTDFSEETAHKPRGRRWKPELGGFRGRGADFLLRIAPLCDWAYCPAGGDARDPGLSVGFAKAEELPSRVFVVACELDMLAHEAWRFVSGLAGRTVAGPVVGRQETAGKGELVLDDERFAWEEQRADGSCYRWLLVPDALHGFDHDLSALANDKEMLEDAAIKRDKTRKMIGEWLRDGALRE